MEDELFESGRSPGKQVTANLTAEETQQLDKLQLQGGIVMHQEELHFYPAHPSNEKTRLIETTPMPLKEQDAPYAVRKLADAFRADLNAALAEYQDKRFEVTGVAIKVGPDIHNKPSVELSDCAGGQCHALCIFPTDDHYSRVSVGDTVTVRANYLVMSNWFGIVMKHSELVRVNKEK